MDPGQVRPSSRPDRISPADATAEMLERIVGKRVVNPQTGDVLIARETLPSLRTTPSGRWRFRVFRFESGDTIGKVFSSFQHAASHAEAFAAESGARLLYLEDEVASLLQDYSRSR